MFDLKKMSISFNLIGNQGRIGNQMFQLSALWGIASNMGYDFCVPNPDVFGLEDPNVRQSDGNIFNTFNLNNLNCRITNYPTICERFFEFDQELFSKCPNNINLQGYFQTEKYFKHIEEDIRTAFTFVDEIKQPTEEEFKSNFGDTEVISIHLRRGDYLKYPHHPVQTLEYYSEGLSHMPDDIPVMVFSDGIEWCKEQQLFQGDRFIFSEGNSTGVDLCLMSLCSYAIIGNSSFSWWGAWLAKSKKTVAPSVWFAGPDTSKNLGDLYLNDWIII